MHGYSHFSCGVIEEPLYIGLVLPLAFICVIHFTLSIYILSKINRCRRELSTNSPTDSPRSKFGTRKAKHSITIITTTFITFYFGLVFGLLSTNPQLRKYSTSLQIAYAIVVATQGPLLFTYTLFSVGSLKTLWIGKIASFCCCKSVRVNTIDVTDPQTDTSAHSSQAATFTIQESVKHKTIATNTNPAYASVMLRRKREEYTMTENDLYGFLN